MKAFADNNLDVNQQMKFTSGNVENIGGKKRNALPAFSPFSTMFSKGYFPRVAQSPDCVVKS